jgi:hypothetical protein
MAITIIALESSAGIVEKSSRHVPASKENVVMAKPNRQTKQGRLSLQDMQVLSLVMAYIILIMLLNGIQTQAPLLT